MVRLFPRQCLDRRAVRCNPAGKAGAVAGGDGYRVVAGFGVGVADGAALRLRLFAEVPRQGQAVAVGVGRPRSGKAQVVVRRTDQYLAVGAAASNRRVTVAPFSVTPSSKSQRQPVICPSRSPDPARFGEHMGRPVAAAGAAIAEGPGKAVGRAIGIGRQAAVKADLPVRAGLQIVARSGNRPFTHQCRDPVARAPAGELAPSPQNWLEIERGPALVAGSTPVYLEELDSVLRGHGSKFFSDVSKNNQFRSTSDPNSCKKAIINQLVLMNGGRPWNRTRHGSPRESYSLLPHLAARRPLRRRDSVGGGGRQGRNARVAGVVLRACAPH